MMNDSRKDLVYIFLIIGMLSFAPLVAKTTFAQVHTGSGMGEKHTPNEPIDEYMERFDITGTMINATVFEDVEESDPPQKVNVTGTLHITSYWYKGKMPCTITYTFGDTTYVIRAWVAVDSDYGPTNPVEKLCEGTDLTGSVNVTVVVYKGGIIVWMVTPIETDSVEEQKYKRESGK